MNSSESLKILICIKDENLGREIQRRVRDLLANIPHVIEKFDEPHRAHREFEARLHDLVIVSQELAGRTASEFHLVLSQVTGHFSYFVLGSDPEDIPYGATFFALPIVDWTEFLGRVQGVLPDEAKTRYGVDRSGSAVYSQLLEYGQRYRHHEAESEYLYEFVSIPRWFEVQSSETVPVKREGDPNLVQEKQARQADPVTLKVQWQEIAVLIGLLVATVLAYYYWESEEGLWVLPNALAVITALSFVGFFSQRILVALAKKAEDKASA